MSRERSRGFGPEIVSVLVLAAVCALLPPEAEGQYFGRNKVQYRTFDFEVLKTEHFDVYFYPEEREGALMAARMAERWRARLGRVLEHELTGRQPLILYASHPHFEQTNVIGGEIGESTGGVTESLRRRIVLPLAGTLAATDHVIGHEIVHAYQFDMTAGREAGGQGMITGAQRLPLWFIEGMAEYLSIGPISVHTAMWMRDAARQEELPGIEDLDDPRLFPYRWGHAFWAWIAGRLGERAVGELLLSAARQGSPEPALEARFGKPLEEINAEWHEALRAIAARVPESAVEAERMAALVTKPGELGGELNVAPALSPDGSRVAFLSERELFSIDLFIAETATGRVIDRISRTDVDPHFSSLQFVNSSGAWDATGSRFVFAAISKGRPTLAIYDVSRRRVVRELALDGLDEAFNPTWSPDGNRIAFSGMTGGMSDLFVADLESGRIEQLTNDAYADLHPAWSPAGDRIAFATDRFTTDLSTLDPGPYAIALLDVASRRIERVPTFEGASHHSPQWGPAGRSLYFVANRGGIANVYRTEPGGGVWQVTNLRTGVSGITATSPALSAASNAERLAFSVFEEGQHRIYSMEGTGPLRGGDLAAALEPPGAALLPPYERRDEQLAQLLENAAFGLPPAGAGEVEDYSPSLALEGVAQPSVSIGRDRFGTYGSGGLSLSFSDMLGNHRLMTTIAMNASFNSTTGFKDIGAAVGYLNMKRRWNWGAFAEQWPYRSGGYGVGQGIVEGQPALIEQTVIYRQTNRAAGGMLMYPVSRAQRVEFSGGFRQLSFDRVVATTAYSAETGRVILDEQTEDEVAAPVQLGEATAALVYDTSVFGATSPVLGQRYRFEVSPVLGSIQFTNVTADYRRYFMPFRFYTLATRLLHVGRYGPDSEDFRLAPLFLGYPTLVRGYDVDSFTLAECGFDPGNPFGRCPAFDRLIGSRMLVANVEFRFPLLRPFGVTRAMYGPLPVEVALFGDAGVAWDRDVSPSFAGGDRRPVSSAGVALRINALGFAVAQLDFVKPFQRDDRGWRFQFSLAPGF